MTDQQAQELEVGDEVSHRLYGRCVFLVIGLPAKSMQRRDWWMVPVSLIHSAPRSARPDVTKFRAKADNLTLLNPVGLKGMDVGEDAGL